MSKRMTTPFLIVYVIHQNCHLQPLRAPRFISRLPLVFATHPIFTSSKKCHHFINLAGRQIREAEHQSRLPAERTGLRVRLQTMQQAEEAPPLCSRLPLTLAVHAAHAVPAVVFQTETPEWEEDARFSGEKQK